MPERYGQKSIEPYQSQRQQQQQVYLGSNGAFSRQPPPPFNAEQQNQQQPLLYQNQNPAPTIPTYQGRYRSRDQPSLPPFIPQNNFVTPFATSRPLKSSSMRPEFISLLADDEEPVSQQYYTPNSNPQPPQPQAQISRFRHQARPLLASAQEVYPSYTSYRHPEGQRQYSRSVRPRSVFQMYPPYNYEGY
jgi:hypothetical protein